MLRGLFCGLALTIGLTLALEGRAVANPINRPVCESLLYKANPDDELYTINVFGLTDGSYEDAPSNWVALSTFLVINLNTIDPSTSTGPYLLAKVEGDRVLIEMMVQGYKIIAMDYILDEREFFRIYIEYVASIIIGECLSQLGEHLRGDVMSTHGTGRLFSHCSSLPQWMVLCSPFFLARETAMATDMSYNKLKMSQRGSEILEDKKSRDFLRTTVSRVLSLRSTLNDPCLVLSAYVGNAMCSRIFSK